MTTFALNATPAQATAFEPDTSAQAAQAQRVDARQPRTDRHGPRKQSQRHEAGSFEPAVPMGTRGAQLLAATSTPTSAGESARHTATTTNRAHNERYADEAELCSLLARYDAGGANAKADALNAALGAQLEKSAMTGYPEDARGFEQNVQIDLGMCADLPLDARTDYEARLKELWTAFEAAPDAWHRSHFADAERALHNDLAGELDAIADDPAARLQAVFNTPFGSDMLDAQGQQQLLSLAEARKQFRLARTEQQREALFSVASQIKQQLQADIASTTRGQIDEQTRLWADARTDVLNALQWATALTGPGATAGARLVEFGNRAFAGARHARAFTELRQIEPDRFRQFTQWENEFAAQDRDAARKLPEVELAPPRNFSDIRFTLPAPGPQYEDQLRALYVDALHGMQAADKRISVAAEPHSSPIRANYIKTHGSTV
ncbi:hypothetical protein [Paraburkholderia jirisanensis]